MAGVTERRPFGFWVTWSPNAARHTYTLCGCATQCVHTSHTWVALQAVRATRPVINQATTGSNP